MSKQCSFERYSVKFWLLINCYVSPLGARMTRDVVAVTSGESVDDCGGGYSESIAETCDELQNGSVPLLIQTPNGRDESGSNRDCYLLNPNLTSPLQQNMFRFLGMLIGIAIRSGSPLSLSLAEPVWKQLAGLPLNVSDLTEIDKDYVPGQASHVPPALYRCLCVVADEVLCNLCL